MDISKIHAGMRIKNYRVLCELLGCEVKGGLAKISHIKDFARYCKYKKVGNAFIIEEILPTPEKRIDKRKDPNKIGNNRKEYKSFKIPMKYEKRNGVYIIENKNEVYIGSAFQDNGFRARFRAHADKRNKTYTRKMLENGGEFKILWMCESELKDEYIVRQLEEFLINYFKENTTYKVINKRMTTHCLNNKKSIEDIANNKGWAVINKQKNNVRCRCLECGYEKNFKRSTLRQKKSSCFCPQCKLPVKRKNTYIRVSADDYDKAIELLKQNNIKIF